MSRLNRHSLSPDPPLINPSSIKYKSGLILQQQERNSPSYQSYKKLNHDYENFSDAAEYILHTGSLASRAKQNQQPLHNMKGLVSKRTAELEAKNKFLQGTLQNNSAVSTLNQTSTTTLLNLSNTMRHKSPFQIVQPKNPASNGLTSSPSLLRGSTSNGSLTTLPSKPSSPYASHRPTLNLPEQPIYQNHQVPFQQQHQHQLQQQQQQLLQQQQLQQQQHLTQTPVQVLYDKASGYKSQIENKVKIMNQTYMSNMHVRVPSQDSSIYSDTKTYIDVGQPIAIGNYFFQSSSISVKNTEIYPALTLFWQNFRESNGFTYGFISRNIFSEEKGNFSFFHTTTNLQVIYVFSSF